MDKTEDSGRVAAWILAFVLRLPGAAQALRRLLLRDVPEEDAGLGFVARLLAEDDFALLRLLADRDPEMRRVLLADTDPQTLHDELAADAYARFIECAQFNDGAGLRAALTRDHHRFLKALIAEEDHALFRELAQTSDSAALKAVLFDDNYAVLKRMLTLNGHAALKAVMLDGDLAWFSMIARSRQGEPLADLLFAEDAALLRDLCHKRGAAALLPVLLSFGPQERSAFVQALLFEGGPGAMDLLARLPDFHDEVLSSPRLHAMAVLLEKWRELRPVLPADDPAMASRVRDGLLAIDSAAHVRGRVLDAITEGDLVRLEGGSMRFTDRHALWTQIHEILLNEDYYFPCDAPAPRIIDGGAHMGMAIYYFKRMYPNARIVAFEPVPELRALAEENVSRNGWRDVEILPFALSPARGTATFHRSRAWSMAGSLSPHRAALGDELEAIEVECVPLSVYLREPVDFLKLDIEGAEDEVLEEAAPLLGNVRNLFCEFHQGTGLASGRLAKILGILETAGFDVQVGKSHNFQETSRTRPLAHFDGAASMVIWGRLR